MTMTIQTFTDSSVQAYLEDLARLRIRVFKDFPYLYEGDWAEEAEYLQTYMEAQDAVLVLAFDGQRVVGASTGVPMEFEPQNVQQPWLEGGFDVKKIFYFGESVLLPSYRGQGLGVRFFEERQKWATALQRFELMAFCGVIRPDNHPLRPATYQPLDDFWQRRGFQKKDGYACKMTWLEVNQTTPTEQYLQFWYKTL